MKASLLFQQNVNKPIKINELQNSFIEYKSNKIQNNQNLLQDKSADEEYSINPLINSNLSSEEQF